MWEIALSAIGPGESLAAATLLLLIILLRRDRDRNKSVRSE